MFHKTQHETISQKYLNNILQSVKQQVQLCQTESVTEKESGQCHRKVPKQQDGVRFGLLNTLKKLCMSSRQYLTNIPKTASILITNNILSISPGINFLVSIDTRPKGTYMRWGLTLIFIHFLKICSVYNVNSEFICRFALSKIYIPALVIIKSILALITFHRAKNISIISWGKSAFQFKFIFANLQNTKTLNTIFKIYQYESNILVYDSM